MKVFLRESIERVGLKGEIIKVSEGYARNFLFPKNLAVEITPDNEQFYAQRTRQIENRKEVVASKTSLLADKISALKLVIKKKTHDDGKLYGALSASDISSALATHGVSISKSQVLFDKSIKAKGSYSVGIKLTAKIQTQVTVTVVSE